MSDKNNSTDKRAALNPRTVLLAQVAGNIAGSVIASPSPATRGVQDVAEVAVDLAEAILKRAGL